MTTAREALVDRLQAYATLVEVGVGRRSAVARALAESGRDVTTTDVVGRDVPDAVTFVVDDVTEPDPEVYANADCVYGLNLPPELHRPARDAAFDADADFRFTTLGGDQPAVTVDRETLPGGETLFLAKRDARGDQKSHAR